MESGIYAIVNILSEEFYIGSAINLKNRWSNHRSFLKTNKHKNKYLQNIYNKYQVNIFIFTVLEYCEKERLIECEQCWINRLRPKYNLSPTAGNTFGVKKTEEERINIGNFHRGKVLSEETKRKMSKPKSEETKRRISLGNLGKPKSDKHKRNMSLAAIRRWSLENERVIK